jgi:hypothetical protein
VLSPEIPDDGKSAPARGDHLEDQGQQRQDEQDVDKPADKEARDQTQEPEDQKDDK